MKTIITIFVLLLSTSAFSHVGNEANALVSSSSKLTKAPTDAQILQVKILKAFKAKKSKYLV